MAIKRLITEIRKSTSPIELLKAPMNKLRTKSERAPSIVSLLVAKV
jgi:hypothetical protein